MRRFFLTLVFAIASSWSFTQGTHTSSQSSDIQTVSVSAKGSDVRGILSDLFNQVKKNFVIQPNIHFALYLSLNDMEFEEALNLICKTASLKYQQQNGVYFITLDKKTTTPSTSAPAEPILDPQTKTTGKLPATILRKKVTVKYVKVDIRELFMDMSAQSGVLLDLDADVPKFKLDADLKNVSLKYALGTICKAAGLTYKYTDHQSLEICKAEEKLVGGGVRIDKG